ncbi:cation acetate symporter [Cryptosporangium phraense]|uniref:Cation acetate symporter n=1 Tax=Cryptosporangium phraense TaxID=2593070 RepID=A0A545AL06_9ACTN|nr:cation acetate symporter [Cryptosporangium phraense]TQS41415.1 cation acetate symporter [Cryptosporangium phraense]
MSADAIFAAEASGTSSGARTLTIVLFLIFVAATLAITIWASRQTRTATDFYAGGRGFSGFQNGLAIGGDYMSAASFLGIAGIIALYGYDGFLYSIGFLVAWLVALLLVAEPLRNSGRFTMADVLSFRMRQRPVRTAASLSTIVVSIFYLLAQMVGAGALVALLLGIKAGETFLGMTADTAKILTIVLVGALMIVYVTIGGMKGTTWVQIVKAALLMTGAALMTVLVLWKFNFNLSSLLGQAAEASGKGSAFLEPGLRYGVETAGDAGKTLTSKLDLISLGLALVLGTAGLPHILIRFYTVPTARAARTSVNWAITLIGIFYLMTLALGFGAAALVGGKAIAAQDAAGNTAAPQLAEELGKEYAGNGGGAVLLAVIAAVAFATILAVVAGLTLASSSSLAHDFYANVVKRGQVSERQEVNVAKIAAFVIGAISIVLAIFAQQLNVAFLVALAFAVAASANLPAILLSLFWKRFNTTGATAGIYGGLIAAVVLVFFSPVVSGKGVNATTGKSLSLFPADVDFHWFPLDNPGLVSIPIGFACAIIGTYLSKERDDEKWAELEVRSLTGSGAV